MLQFWSLYAQAEFNRSGSKGCSRAKKAAFVTALVVALSAFLRLCGGWPLKEFPDLANAKLALPTMLMTLSPVAAGIVLASPMAAILSTVSPIILASGTMVTKDIYQKRLKPTASDAEVLKMSRITTAIAGVICTVMAILMYGSTRILDMVYFAYSIRGALFVVLLLGIYWRKTSKKGAIWGMICTAVVGCFWAFIMVFMVIIPFIRGFPRHMRQWLQRWWLRLCSVLS